MHLATIIISGTQNIISGSGITHLPVMLLPSILDLYLKYFMNEPLASCMMILFRVFGFKDNGWYVSLI